MREEYKKLVESVNNTAILNESVIRFIKSLDAKELYKVFQNPERVNSLNLDETSITSMENMDSIALAKAAKIIVIELIQKIKPLKPEFFAKKIDVIAEKGLEIAMLLIQKIADKSQNEEFKDLVSNLDSTSIDLEEIKKQVS